MRCWVGVGGSAAEEAGPRGKIPGLEKKEIFEFYNQRQFFFKKACFSAS